MNIKRTVGRLIGAGTTATMVAVMGMGTAYADPPAATYRNIPIVGSDTTEEVMNAAAEDSAALAIGGVKKVASYNATGSANISTKDPGTSPGCTFTRPNGSGNGRTALLNSLNSAHATFGCLQGSRSSSLNQAAAATQLTYIPFATENITFAVSGTSDIPLDLTAAEVVGFWNCTISGNDFRAMLPQSGSGTFQYWATKMYGSTTVPPAVITTNGGCVQNGLDESGVSIQEHRGTQVNKANEISLYSVAQWTAQTAGVTSNFRGTTRLGQIDKFNPFGATFATGYQRDLYNVFPASVIDAASPTGITAEIQTLFKGSTSQICNTAIVLRYGLVKAATCGSTSLDTA